MDKFYPTYNHIHKYKLFTGNNINNKNNIKLFNNEENITTYIKYESYVDKCSANINALNPINNSYDNKFNIMSYSYYVNPEFIDLINFYNIFDTDLDFNNYFGENILIKNVNNIEQLWYNNVTNNGTLYQSFYPQDKQYQINVKNNFDITKSALSNDMMIIV